MIELLWPDGNVTTGSTFNEVEQAVRSAQWQPFKTRREFRRDMRRRAEVWGGERVRVGVGALTSPETFLRALAGAGMFMIHESEETL